MLDELLDLFDPDRQRPRTRRGIRGWIGRDDDDDRPSATGRRRGDRDDLHPSEERLIPVPVRDERAALNRSRRRRSEPDWEI
jgi:hypothetical protein